MKLRTAYIVDYKRSAFTRAHPFKKEVDPFSETRGDTLLAQLIDNRIDASKYLSSEIDDLSIGCALPVREQWSFGGRYPIFLSKIGHQCASRTIEQQCGSGLAAMRFAEFSIATGAADISFAGGYENMSQVPIGPSLYEQGVLTQFDFGSIKNSDYDLQVVMNMGLTAEKLCQLSGIDRKQMDEFAESSHKKASDAKTQGFFDGEIISLTNAQGISVASDTCIRTETNFEKLATLAPVFLENGQITAGNTSPLTTGATLAVIMSEEAVNRLDVKPLARIICSADCGTHPELMGQGVVPAVKKALGMAKIRAEDIDYWEINEAFSVVPLFAIESMGIDSKRVNIKGGALALGHPLGATGIRLAGTLARILQQQNGQYGCAAACIGGGQGIAMIIEKM